MLDMCYPQPTVSSESAAVSRARFFFTSDQTRGLGVDPISRLSFISHTQRSYNVTFIPKNVCNVYLIYMLLPLNVFSMYHSIYNTYGNGIFIFIITKKYIRCPDIICLFNFLLSDNFEADSIE